MLPPTSKKVAAAGPPQKAATSKAQQRKLRQVAQEKERRQQLAEVCNQVLFVQATAYWSRLLSDIKLLRQAYQILKNNQLPEEQLKLLRPTAWQGQQLSKRQRLSQELAEGANALLSLLLLSKCACADELLSEHCRASAGHSSHVMISWTNTAAWADLGSMRRASWVQHQGNRQPSQAAHSA